MSVKKGKWGLVFGLSCLPALLLIGQNAVGAHASASHKVLLSDTFNDKSYAGALNETMWTDRSDSRIAQSKGGSAYLNYASPNAGGENIVFSTKGKIQNIHYYQFDFKFGKTNRWISPVFMDACPDRDGNRMRNYAYAGISAIYSDRGTGLAGQLEKAIDFNSLLGTNAQESWLTCRITITDSTSGTIGFKKQGSGSFEDTSTSPFTYNSLSSDLTYSYIGIVAETAEGSVDLDNFVVRYGDGQEITEGFDAFDFEEPNDFTFFKDSPSRNVECTIVDSSTLEMGNAKEGDFILGKKPIEGDTSIVEEVEIANLSLFVQFPESATSDERIGLAFGLSKDPESLKENAVIYEIGKDYGVLSEYRNGEEKLDGSENKNRFENVSGSGSSINVKIYKNGRFLVYENGKKVKSVDGSSSFDFARVGDVSGYFALAALSDLGNGIVVDNVKLVNSLYYVPVTKSVTHNFSNPYFGNKGREDFVLIDGDGGGELHVDNGKLVFDCATDGTFFGSAHQYDDFILDFKVCSILADDSTEDPSKTATTLGRWIGLDLSRDKKTYGAYGKYATLITQLVPNVAYGTTYSPAIWSDSEISRFSKDDVTITVHKQIDASLMQDIQYRDAMSEGNVEEGNAVCFRFVSEGGNLKMYLKKAKETEYRLYYEVNGLELNGYFALCCTGFTFIKIDDFSMTNTSSVYVCADNDEPETITDKETEVVYDHNNVDTNLDEEIRLNTGANALGIVFIALASAEALGILALGFLLLKGRKKR